jgi:hypothetical protein
MELYYYYKDPIDMDTFNDKINIRKFILKQDEGMRCYIQNICFSADRNNSINVNDVRYEEKTKSYIVLELKINRAFAKADKELECYTDTIKKWIDDANDLYDVKAENVKGYIVWNAPERICKEIKNQWGMIEYDIDVLKKDVEKLEFSIVTDPIS